jgi:flavin-binding protein dodecin
MRPRGGPRRRRLRHTFPSIGTVATGLSWPLAGFQDANGGNVALGRQLTTAPGQDGKELVRRRIREVVMDEHIYRVIQLVGSSDQSIDDAIRRAISRASKTLRNLGWFEVVETRGSIEEGKLSYQVTLKVGFTMEG